MSRSFFLVVTLTLGISAGRVFAQNVHTPAAGGSERKAVMDVLRKRCEADLGVKVIFQVQLLRVTDKWAFARVVPVRPDGKAVDYARTKYAEQLAEGAFDAEGEALLRRSGETWKLVEWRFGATDTEVEIWREKYDLPRALLE